MFVAEDLKKFSNLADLPIDNNNSDTSPDKKEENTFFSEVKDHVLYFADPFLLKAFEKYLPLKENEGKGEHESDGTNEGNKSAETIKQSLAR